MRSASGASIVNASGSTPDNIGGMDNAAVTRSEESMAEVHGARTRRRGRSIYFDEQSAEIIRTEETFSVFAPSLIRDDAEPLVVVDVAVEAAPWVASFSSFPVTSMRWPTWFFSSLVLPSSWYEVVSIDELALRLLPVVPVAVVLLVVLPDVPAVVSAFGAALAIRT